ncbi:hypothetical protein [Sorangium cellulosum]|uniref:Uncharacterized protein n=1 Tax=Sorangium cellulosum So0157-2 TaxID=1254432 RepID=S4XYN8_SORCE|nr:hypothetical protein [Sorangium cellulosum]AGP38342.1 hypothetical protein SCE1572_29985 [Sorangium cellulosum So0157-2]
MSKNQYGCILITSIMGIGLSLLPGCQDGLGSTQAGVHIAGSAGSAAESQFEDGPLETSSYALGLAAHAEGSGDELDASRPDLEVGSTSHAASDGCWDWCTAGCDRDLSSCAYNCIILWGHYDDMGLLGQCIQACYPGFDNCTENCFFMCE